MAALVEGSLALRGRCVVLQHEESWYPVVWPSGTDIASADPFVIRLPSGETLAIGEWVSGGGGYLHPEQLDVEVAPECLPATNEVAVFNPGDKPSKAEQNAGVALHRSERESGVVYGTRTHNFRRHNPLVLRIRAQIQPLPGP